MAYAAGGQTLSPADARVDASLTPEVQSGFARGERGNEDWNRVRTLVNGQEIVISTGGKHGTHCLFSGATANLLFCEPKYDLTSAREYRFDRAEVVMVRLDQWGRNAKLAIGTTAAAGFVWGAVQGSNPRSGYTYPRVVTGLAGGVLGGLVGCAVAVPAAFLIRGHLVYRQPKAEWMAHAASRWPRESGLDPQLAAR